MCIKINQDIVTKIRKADIQGVPREQRKPLYVEQNMLGVDFDKPIYRIFQCRFIEQDIKNSSLTHVKASPLVWGDPFENPLLNISFRLETGESLYLDSLVDKFYALSWTTDTKENIGNWNDFSHGMAAIRIKTTPKKLLDRIMNLENRYYMLHHYMGLVEYKKQDDIVKMLKDTPWQDYLDSLGQGVALSLMTLREKFSNESEVRLLYSYEPNQHDNSWVEENVSIVDDTCVLPFEWTGIIDEILLGPLVTCDDEQRLTNLFQQRGIDCAILSSEFRQI